MYSINFATDELPWPALFITILCISLIPIGIYLRFKEARKIKPVFPLLALPAELRLQILDHVISDAKANRHDRADAHDSTTFRRCKPEDSRSTISSIRSYLVSPPLPLYTTLTNVNRQLTKEFIQLFCQRETFTYTLDASRTDSCEPFWRLTPRIKQNLRYARIKLLATPGLGAGLDPRTATGRWLLRDRVLGVVEELDQLKDLKLSIQACGNQLWNPIWLWHYTSQSFKESGNKAFTRMSFDLEGWNMREPNHLERNHQGRWEWQCSEGHFVHDDVVKGAQPIREFCAALYAECTACNGIETNTT